MLRSSRILGSSNGSPASQAEPDWPDPAPATSFGWPGSRRQLTMYFVYILESISTGRWYIGSTQNLDSRLVMHNTGRVRSSKPYLLYKMVYTEMCETRGEAMQREQAIKRSGAIRKGIKNELKRKQSGIV